MNDIIIVDDESEILSVLTQLFESEGYAVRSYTDPRRALESARHTPPALALIDIMMPFLSGPHLIQLLRTEVDAQLPIIAMSASINYQQMRDLHIHDFFEKPFDLDDVLHRVETLVGAAHTHAPH